jgi:hypothetical protein
MNYLIGFLMLLVTLISSSFASSFKNDILRIEFQDKDQIESIDLHREYEEENDHLIVKVRPEKVEQEFKRSHEPSVKWIIDVQAGTVSVLSNFLQNPNEVGTKFNLDGKTIASYRIYFSTLIKNKHEIRLLYAPLAYNVDFVSEDNIMFGDNLFLMGLETEAFYKFNSYRLSYIFHFDQVGKVQFRLGFTAKIRDAETSLTQGSNKESFTDLGFVPLLHIGANVKVTKNIFIDIDTDVSWAPQGYAVDSRLSAGYHFNNISVGAGVGYLSGGANVPSVNTYASLFYAYGKVVYTFPVKKKK